ncbi:hypothetical protein Patl1_33439 [Pistacia atlantica]|uniref:Uncharacterized protein n=1 Tax=Pistacia atlantica TaxID=434234 RepID=A0ACC0ZRC8_9ROSI|nr:hypothetical protein Patl1_33439 [Pistacia atlantica]
MPVTSSSSGRSAIDLPNSTNEESFNKIVLPKNAGKDGQNIVHPFPLSLEAQLSNFKEVVSLLKQQVGDAEAEQILMNAVYLSSIGGVDYIFGNIYPNATESEMENYVQLVIGNITNVIKEMYALGGRKFAFQNVGPLGCTPLGIYHASDCGIGDYELCRNPNEYVFFDGEHLTDRAYSRLAELFWEGGMNVTAPLNMKQLLELEVQPSEIKKFREDDDDDDGASNDE